MRLPCLKGEREKKAKQPATLPRCVHSVDPTLPHQLAGLSARRGREEKEGHGELETGRLLTPSPCKPKVCALMGEGWVGVAALRPKAACAILQRAFDSGPITPTRT